MKKIFSCLVAVIVMIVCICTGCSGEKSELVNLQEQIEILQEQINELQELIAQSQDKNEELQKRLEKTQNQLDGLQGQFKNLNFVPEKPEDTSLEFWIVQDVAEYDFSEHAQEYGWFGCDVYYGKDYSPEIISMGCDRYIIDPEYYVKYRVEAYPDYADGGQYITDIEITDPNVTVYGLTCESSFDEFDETFRKMGYSIYEYEDWHSANLGAVHFSISTYKGIHEMEIWVEVTNRDGIDF